MCKFIYICLQFYNTNLDHTSRNICVTIIVSTNVLYFNFDIHKIIISNRIARCYQDLASI